MTVSRLTLFVLAGLALGAGPLEAQQEDLPPIGTGRPSFATGPGIVPRFQVEAGYQFADANAQTNRHALGQVMLRFPTTPRLELRAGLGSFEVQDAGETRRQGLQDVTVGAKLQLLTAGDAAFPIPAIAILAATSLPTAQDGLGSDEVQPSVNLILAWPVGERFQVISNTIARSRFAGDERFREMAQGLYLGYDVPGPIGTFVEVHGNRARGGDASTSLGIGITYLVSRDLQLDVHGGTRLSGEADRFRFGAGVGWRR